VPRSMSGDAGPNDGPLAGLTVVALEQAVSAPICTRTLGDFGARVIKVENPAGGDFARHYDDVVNGLAAHFVWANRGKESIALNLADPDGLRVLHLLLDRADVLVSNLTPGATAKLGIAPDDLAARHPELIAVEIDGYGPRGRARSRAFLGHRPRRGRRSRTSVAACTRRCRSWRCSANVGGPRQVAKAARSR